MNDFLTSLDERTLRELREHLSEVRLSFGEVIYGPGEAVRWVYFPETALISVLMVNNEGRSVETGMIGREGAAGLIEACADTRAEFTYLVQVDGRSLRAPAQVVRRLVGADDGLRAQAWRLAAAQVAEARRSQLCMALHSAEARLARWLLESQERSGGRNPLPLTQEMLAALLGVQRSTVNPIAGKLRSRGLIRHVRGQIEIVDPAGLERVSCECFAAGAESRHERDRLDAHRLHGGLPEAFQ
jgi:CRP-like cAMP-binding protein